MKLLWIEDEVWLLSAIKDTLEEADVTVETAQSFVEAKEILKNSSFDAYLVDLIMPHGDDFDNEDNRVLPEHHYAGLRVVMEIRKVDKLSPIYIFSVISDEKVEKHLRQYGVTKILRKNILPSKLKQELLNID